MRIQESSPYSSAPLGKTAVSERVTQDVFQEVFFESLGHTSLVTKTGLDCHRVCFDLQLDI